MKNIKKLLCAVLTVVMMVSLMSAALAAGTFVDVPEDSPYAEYIEDIYARTITNGVSATEFGPKRNLTRAQFVTFIGRLAGVDDTKYTESHFDDIDSVTQKWAGGYIEWAYALGITNGKSATKFAPSDYMTRLEMATFMLRFADKYGVNLNKSPNPAADLEEIASKYPDTLWKGAEKAVKLFGGYSIDLDENGKFNPKELARREEMAKVISMFPEPVGGFVIPQEDPPTEGGNIVKINGKDYVLKPGSDESFTIIQKEKEVKYDGTAFSNTYGKDVFIPAGIPVTIVCADKEVKIASEQLNLARFVFYKDGKAIEDENDGVTYAFRFAYPGSDGQYVSPEKFVSEIIFELPAE